MLQSEREKSENIDLKSRIERVQQEGQSQQREIQELRSENQTLRQMFQQKEQAWQERVGGLEREIKKLQDQVRDLEQKNSQSVTQESSKVIEDLNRENKIFKNLIDKLIGSKIRKKAIKEFYDSGEKRRLAGRCDEALDHQVLCSGWELCLCPRDLLGGVST